MRRWSGRGIEGGGGRSGWSGLGAGRQGAGGAPSSTPFLSSDMRQPTSKVWGWLRIAAAASGGTNIQKHKCFIVFCSLRLQSEHVCTQAGTNGAQVASAVSIPTCQTAHGAWVASGVSFRTYPSPSCRMPPRLEAMARWSGRGIERGGGRSGRSGLGAGRQGAGGAPSSTLLSVIRHEATDV